MKQFLGAAALLALAACVPPQPPRPLQDHGWRAIDISAAPASLDRHGLGASRGALIFRGGLKLTSTDRAFGGWSSLKVDPDGRLIGLSDEGWWLSLKVDLDPASGALRGVSEARIARLRGTDGEPLGDKRFSDSEGLARLPDGRFAVSFEHRHRILFYDLDGAGPTAPAQDGPPVVIGDLTENEGLESVTAGPGGDLFAGSEQPPPGQSSPRFYRYKLGAAPEKALIAAGPAQTSPGNALVDMDQLPNGDLVALERFYAPLLGNRTAIRRYLAVGLEASTPALAGPLLASFAKPPDRIDNFEGIAAATMPNGVTRLYIISDDNYSPIQETLLYAFDLAPEPNPAAKPTPKGKAQSAKKH